MHSINIPQHFVQNKFNTRRFHCRDTIPLICSTRVDRFLQNFTELFLEVHAFDGRARRLLETFRIVGKKFEKDLNYFQRECRCSLA